MFSVGTYSLSHSISRSNLPTSFVQAMVLFYSEHSRLFKGVKLFPLSLVQSPALHLNVATF